MFGFFKKKHPEMEEDDIVIINNPTFSTNIELDSAKKLNYHTLKEDMKTGYVPINIRFPSSKPNRINAEGLSWATTKDLKENRFTVNPDGDKAYIDNIMMFKEFGDVNNGVSPYGKVFKVNDKTQGDKILSIDLCSPVFFEKLNLTRTILTLGGVGSGKTEWALSIVTQTHLYNRLVYHDIKGDFVNKLYREGKDIIFNLYDERGTDWNFFEDMQKNQTLSNAFAKAMVLGSLGKDSDDNEWVGFASNVLIDAFAYAFRQTKDNKQRWLHLLDKLEDYKAEANSGDDKNKSSVWMNVQTPYEILKIMAYRIAVLNKPTFNIYGYFQTNDVQLFLLNNAAYEAKLNPLFGAFLSSFINIMMSRKDTKTDMTMLMLDEFLSLRIPETEQNKLFTAARSKGCQTIVMAQYLQKSDEKLLQLIESSRYALLLFGVKETYTLENMSKGFGKITYWQKVVSSSSSRNLSNSANASNDKNKDEILNNTSSITRNLQDTKTECDVMSIPEIQGIPPYHHITYVSGEKILYLGYTPSVPSDRFFNNETMIVIDQDSMEDWFYKNDFKTYLLNHKTQEQQEILEVASELKEQEEQEEEIIEEEPANKRIKQTKTKKENEKVVLDTVVKKEKIDMDLKYIDYCITCIENNNILDVINFIQSNKAIYNYQFMFGEELGKYLMALNKDTKENTIQMILRDLKNLRVPTETIEKKDSEIQTIIDSVFAPPKEKEIEPLLQQLKNKITNFKKNPKKQTIEQLEELKRYAHKINHHEMIFLLEQVNLEHIEDVKEKMVAALELLVQYEKEKKLGQR